MGEACNEMWQCEGFVYMGTQRKCWRRRNINLPACERGQWNTESSEFITCLKPSCKPQGQSYELQNMYGFSFPSSCHLRFMFGGRSQEHHFRVQQPRVDDVYIQRPVAEDLRLCSLRQL